MEVVDLDECDAATAGQEQVQVARHLPEPKRLDPGDEWDVARHVPRQSDDTGGDRMDHHDIAGLSPRHQPGVDPAVGLPWPRLAPRHAQAAGEPGQEERAQGHDVELPGKLAHEQGGQQHRGRQCRQHVTVDVARGRVAQEIEAEQPETGCGQPEPQQEGPTAEEPANRGPADDPDRQRGKKAERKMVSPAPAAEWARTGQQACRQEERPAQGPGPFEAAVLPARGDPPLPQARRHQSIPGQHQEERDAREDGHTRARTQARDEDEPCQAGEPHERKEVMGQQPRRPREHPGQRGREVAGSTR